MIELNFDEQPYDLISAEEFDAEVERYYQEEQRLLAEDRERNPD